MMSAASRMDRDGVTIAIPNWNHETFLPRAIASGLAAVRRLRDGGRDGEVLVVDDASRDGSHALLRVLEARYRREGLRVRIRPSNGGLAAARNEGLLEARFRAVVFLDADNEVLADNLPLFLQALDETGAAAVYGNLLIHTLGQPTPHHLISNESVQVRMFEDNEIDALALFDRGQVIDVGGYSGALPAWEDWELWLHLATSGRRIVFVPMVFGVYHRLPHSMLASVAPPGHAETKIRCHQIFDQVQFRKHRPPRTTRLRYMPGVGAL
jgi:succinoglycan biosynthesis protein ExoO